ncbi:fluoroquinolone export ABC transporter permease subunit [Desulfuribacillus alkaliarsenatis]|uniref:ABC transporter permease n=1 Tax=Desulfuribacillus alkaliarsenatis TaxID=766136 RepID=A0A1E5G323_9FIRM|nr:ABC transporter permease [Desulfuribacillus alkaliarsenatis]OEF97453.1 ABC transporter permease [Desulfuribacillus alkaliarsenatis]
MSNFAVLLTGELQRIKKYNILAASFVVLLIWLGMLHFSGVEDVSAIFPLLVILDATSMAIIMIGVTVFFERQEGVLKTLMVAPITKFEYVLAKISANILLNMKTIVILYVYAVFFKDISINIFLLLFAVLLVSLFHSLVGLLLTFYSKDFTSLLMNMMKYVFVLLIPVLLEQLQILTGDLITTVLYAVPTKASMILINASVEAVELWEILLSVSYLSIAAALLLRYSIIKFHEFAARESGI